MLEFASEALRNDKEIVLALVSKNARVREFASEALRRDRDVALAVALAVAKSEDPCMGNVAMEPRDDINVMLVAVEREPHEFVWASERLKKDKRAVYEAVKRGGRALEHADPKLRGGRKVVLVTVSNNGTALDFAFGSVRRTTLT